MPYGKPVELFKHVLLLNFCATYNEEFEKIRHAMHTSEGSNKHDKNKISRFD